MMMKESRAIEKIKRSFDIVQSSIRNFAYTDYYIIAVLIVVCVAWATKCAPFGFIALISLSCVMLIFLDDILPLTVNIFGAVLMIYSNSLDEFLYLWPIFIVLGLSIAVFIVRNIRHKFSFGKMFFPQLAVCLALLLGGLGTITAENYLRALPTILFLGFGVLAIYVLYNLFLKRTNSFDVFLYFSRTLMYIGLAVCFELLVTIIRSGLPTSLWNTGNWSVGWGNRNNIATYLILTAAMTFYLSTRYKHGWIYLAIGLIQYICIIFTFSRGGILFGGLSGICALGASIAKAIDKKRQLIAIGSVTAVLLIAYFCLFDKANSMFVSLLSRGTSLSGRDLLYAEAWELFKNNPLLGVGVGYTGNGPGAINVMQIYWFHSTFFETIATMGMIGFLLYCYYYGKRIYLLFKGGITKKFNLFVLIAWIGFEGYSMIDTGTMVPYPNMMLIIVMCLLLELSMKTCNFEDGANIKEAFLPRKIVFSLSSRKEKSGENTALQVIHHRENAENYFKDDKI